MSASSEVTTFRAPRQDDAQKIEQLVTRSGVLDVNSCYAYLLLCTHFSSTCLVAEQDDCLVGFVTAYRPPSDPEAVFVWQVGVASEAQGQGIAKRLLRELLRQPACRDARVLHATVSPSNIASRRLFESLARELNCSVTESPCFAAEDFGQAQHEDEPLLVIGPFSPTSN